MNWNLFYEENKVVKNYDIKTVNDLKNAGFKTVPTKVPGNFELDLMRAGLLPDLYYSDNVLLAQKLEAIHVFYYAIFDMPNENMYLHFNGIDTIADIYVNGELVKQTDNMFMEYDVFAPYKKKDNEIIVHIKPVEIEARKYTVPVSCYANTKYNYSFLGIRKAMHSSGWDILPRIVTSGIWKDVEIRENKNNKIEEAYIFTTKFNQDYTKAFLCLYLNTKIDGDKISEYSVRVRGKCAESLMSFESRLWSTSGRLYFQVDNPNLWWPKNVGVPNIYQTKIELLKNGRVLDAINQNIGIRIIELDRTDEVKEGGRFNFIVNGKKVFVTGTNWVPLDAIHGNDINRLNKALSELDELGCNMVRCWGGNVYEREEFFDFCDKHGIMIWQDFMMACASYPEDEKFIEKLKEEVTYVIKKKRIHPSLALWSGDNEVDWCYESWGETIRNPEDIFLTRKLIPHLIRMHDQNRPYLPSSPYISSEVHEKGLKPAEWHNWGPRENFKCDHYKFVENYFISEVGYTGCPSPVSFKKFIKDTDGVLRIGDEHIDEYCIHGTSMETDQGPYKYRYHAMDDEIKGLFRNKPANVNEYIYMSQITQAEAEKFFIESMRVKRDTKGGILVWNFLDGWPEFSEAAIDYYFVRKLAFDFIKRAQNPICCIFDEPIDNYISLIGVNDTFTNKSVEYKVTCVTDNKVIMSGTVEFCAESAKTIDKIKIEENEHKFYLVEYSYDEKKYYNHYYTNLQEIEFDDYYRDLKAAGLDKFYGFN